MLRNFAAGIGVGQPRCEGATHYGKPSQRTVNVHNGLGVMS
jgi:hypothetical protein